MPGIVIALLILWAVFAIVGFAIHALLWLAIIALVLFAITIAVGLTQYWR